MIHDNSQPRHFVIIGSGIIPGSVHLVKRPGDGGGDVAVNGACAAAALCDAACMALGSRSDVLPHRARLRRVTEWCWVIIGNDS